MSRHDFSVAQTANTDAPAGGGASGAGGVSSTAPAVSDGSRRLFSDEEFAELARRIMRDGGRWRDVAAATGYSVAFAKDRGNKLGIYSANAHVGTWPWPRVRRAAELAAKHGTKIAAEIMGVKDGTLRMALSRAGISVVRLRAKVRAEAGLA